MTGRDLNVDDLRSGAERSDPMDHQHIPQIPAIDRFPNELLDALLGHSGIVLEVQRSHGC